MNGYRKSKAKTSTPKPSHSRQRSRRILKRSGYEFVCGLWYHRVLISPNSCRKEHCVKHNTQKTAGIGDAAPAGSEITGRDHEEAEAISTQTHVIARRLLELLPSDTPLPVISPEPDGQINFEWYRASRRLLTTSISGTGILYWAALMDSEDPRGSCQFADQFPPTLLYWIGMVCG